MEIHILESPDVIAKRVALSIAILIKNNPGRLVCFAAGDTPLGMLHNSENLYVLASGKHKANIIKKAFGEEPTFAVPASLLQRHTNLIVVLDKDASTEL